MEEEKKSLGRMLCHTLRIGWPTTGITSKLHVAIIGFRSQSGGIV